MAWDDRLPEPYRAPPAPPAGQKSATVAGLLSFLLPGAGQLYVGRRVARGVSFLVLWLVIGVWNLAGWLTLLILVGLLVLAVGLPAALVVWLWAIVDAADAAEEHNREVLARRQP